MASPYQGPVTGIVPASAHHEGVKTRELDVPGVADIYGPGVKGSEGSLGGGFVFYGHELHQGIEAIRDECLGLNGNSGVGGFRREGPEIEYGLEPLIPVHEGIPAVRESLPFRDAFFREPDIGTEA